MPTIQRAALYSDAVLILARAGVSAVDVAKELGLHKASTARQLSGETKRKHPRLFDVIADLAGEDVAEQVAAVLADEATP